MEGWEEKWPNHWVFRSDIRERRMDISVFKHREIGGDGLTQRWVVSLESPVAGARQTLTDKTLTVEQAQAEALKIAASAMADASAWIGQVVKILAEAAPPTEEGR